MFWLYNMRRVVCCRMQPLGVIGSMKEDISLIMLHFELNGLLYRYSVRQDSLIVLQYYTYLGRLVLMHCSGVKYQRKAISLSHLPCRKTKKQIFKLFFLTGTLSCGNRITHCILVLVDIHSSVLFQPYGFLRCSLTLSCFSHNFLLRINGKSVYYL